jgi:hypothetical protein
MMTSFRIGIDVGGTFTDLWALASDGRVQIVKTPTTPDVITGILAALRLVAEAFDVGTPELCGAIERFGHGTTAALNALLTGRAAKTAVLTTLGFGDTLEAALNKLPACSPSYRDQAQAVCNGTMATSIWAALITSVSASACICLTRWRAVLARLQQKTALMSAGRIASRCLLSLMSSQTSR